MQIVDFVHLNSVKFILSPYTRFYKSNCDPSLSLIVNGLVELTVYICNVALLICTLAVCVLLVDNPPAAECAKVTDNASGFPRSVSVIVYVGPVPAPAPSITQL